MFDDLIPDPKTAKIESEDLNFQIDKIDFEELYNLYKNPGPEDWMYQRAYELSVLKNLGMPDDVLDMLAEESLKRPGKSIFSYGKEFLNQKIEEKKKNR